MKKSSVKKRKAIKDKALEFINIGVSCNCLVALYESGILEKLLNSTIINKSDIENCDNPACIKSALTTLEKSNVIKIKPKSNCFQLTDLGKSLSEYIGLITIFFDGYGGLIANQSQIVKNKIQITDKLKLVRWSTVAKSSMQISEEAIDPILIEEFLKLKHSGTICDLGCGHGSMLSKVCEETGNPGLGFENSPETVNQIREQLVKKNIKIEVADITQLQGVWKEVVFLMQAFVFHDFNPASKCITIIDSYLRNFPNLRYFFYIDIVTPSQAKNELFPGFDYVHGLLGVPTRNYEDTLAVFDHSKFEVIKEINIPDLPNTFLWILSPKRKET